MKSVEMAQELARYGVSHELITVPNAGHGLSGGDKTLIDDAHVRVLMFVRKHLM